MQVEEEKTLPAEMTETRKKFVLVCQGLFCMSRGSWHILNDLKKLKADSKLPDEVEVQAYYCFNGCSHGPNIVCHPDKVWFERVTPQNFKQVLDYICEGKPVSDSALTQARVLEIVRQNAFAQLEKELDK
jgi:(2Fe-2S) ferredoxin